jgi:hypothetical protein
MKRLACVFGRHRWTIRDTHDKAYEVCSRCGKRTHYRPSGDEEFGRDYPDDPGTSKVFGDAGNIFPPGP